MPTADEILATMSEEDEKRMLVIDNDLRTIKIPKEVRILGVESDDDVHRLHFRMPKMCGEFDLSEFELRVNYMNAGNEPDLYEVKDAAVSGDVIEFSWLVGRTAAKFKGDVKFIVCAKLIKADGVVEKEFNTTVAKLPVLEGLETSEAVVQLHPDIIEAILLRLSKLETDGAGTVSPEAIAQAVADYFAENPQSGIPDEAGAVRREHIADLAINGAKLNYESVSNAKIMPGTIQKDRMAADALTYLTSGPYVSVSYDGAARADITQGKHVFALRLIEDESRNLRTWLLNHSTYDGVYLHQGTDIEGPIKLLDRTDFIGGIHGGEQLVSMRMIADGVDVTGSTADLAGVKTLSVYVTSTVHDENGGAALFSREKVLTFSGTSLTVENRWVYTGAESVSVERWPGCGLYSVFAANSLGYTTCKTLMPSVDALGADAAVKEVAFWVSGTRVTVQALRGMDGASYAGIIEVLDGASRIKAYLDTIHAPEGYALNTGDVLEAAYRITIGEETAGRINEIPKELPNPFSLTINGMSYDGSAKKEITIQPGSSTGGAAIDDTTPSATTTYSSQKIEEELSAQKEAIDEQDERLTTLEQASGIVTVEPAEGDVPLLFYSEALPQTKTDTAMPISYASKTLKRDDADAETKAQGTSSLSYAKKNQTTKFSQAFNFKGWGLQKKYCMKANWIDLTHARNIVSAQLWGDVVKSRSNYLDLPELLRTSPNQGAVDGFPALVYANGVYQGRYTINIPKDAWMANMDDSLDEHCILCGENYVSGCFRAAANINGSDWSDEVHDTVPAAIKTRWNEIISFVMNSTDDEFVSGIGNYFYLDSLIDYYLFGVVTCGLDAFGKNQLYMTYDGQKWIASMYDMDSTWGLWWNGSSFVATNYARTEFQDFKDGEGNLLYIRLEELFYEQIQARWAELKESVLSYANIMTRFERFIEIVPPHIVKEDYASTTGGGSFTGIPSQNTNHIQQIRAYVAARLPYADEWFASLTPAEEVPCTGIVLDQTTLTFAAAGTQTLTATVTPSDTTDPIIWSSNAEDIASVSNGVVTAKANGNATITATCGAYSASCAVGVSGVSSGTVDDGVDYTLDALSDVAWTSGQNYNSLTGAIQSVSNENVSSKFTAQDCLYALTSTDANNQYIALYTFDENDNILWTKEWASVTSEEVVQLKVGYKYALKAYNTSTFDGNTLSLIPIDNRETMGAETVIDLSGLAESDITYSAGDKQFEINITDRCGGLITAVNGAPAYSGVNRFSVQLFVKGYANNQAPKLPTSMQESHPIYWRLGGWQTNVLLWGYSNRITSAAAMAEYLAQNAYKIVLNGAPTN